MDGGAWCPWGRKESDMIERLHFHFFNITSDKDWKFEIKCTFIYCDVYFANTRIESDCLLVQFKIENKFSLT